MTRRQYVRREGDLAYEIAAVAVAILICACTYYIATKFTAPAFGPLAETTRSPG